MKNNISYCEFMHTEHDLLKLILSSYLSSYSLEEIKWQLDASGYNYNMDDKDQLLDYLIQSNF